MSHREDRHVTVTALDHLVLTVADVERTIDFYVRVLGMRRVVFAGGRLALAFGSSKINLHEVGRELSPHARHPIPGSADLCLVTSTPQPDALDHVAACGVPAEMGPVARTGARGPVTSTYVRDRTATSSRSARTGDRGSCGRAAGHDLRGGGVGGRTPHASG